MIDGKPLQAARAYKDIRRRNMIMSRESDRRHHASSGIVFNALQPGCVADTALFRKTPHAFRTLVPWSQKQITKGYGSQPLAGERVAQVVIDPESVQSGV